MTETGDHSMDQGSYKYFKSTVPLNKIAVGVEDDKVWKYYDFGPKTDKVPLVFLPSVAGSASDYYKLILALSAFKRVISAEAPPYWTHLEWVQGFELFLNAKKIEKVHLFGSHLGGFLAQCFTQNRPNRVESLILCNSFCDTLYFHNDATCVSALRYMPEFYLKRAILEKFPPGRMEQDIADSIDFTVHSLENLTQSEVASRLMLNCCTSDLQLLPMPSNRITILDCMDEVSIPDSVRQEVYKRYPYAKLALLKSGGNFPYLSRADEVFIHVKVHLRTVEQLNSEPQAPASQSMEQLELPVTATEAPAVVATATAPAPAPAVEAVVIESPAAAAATPEVAAPQAPVAPAVAAAVPAAVAEAAPVQSKQRKPRAPQQQPVAEEAPASVAGVVAAEPQVVAPAEPAPEAAVPAAIITPTAAAASVDPLSAPAATTTAPLEADVVAPQPAAVQVQPPRASAPRPSAVPAGPPARDLFIADQEDDLFAEPAGKPKGAKAGRKKKPVAATAPAAAVPAPAAPPASRGALDSKFDAFDDS